MTVAELIEWLRKLDQTKLVMIDCSDEYYSGPLTQELLEDGREVERLGACDYELPDLTGRSGMRQYHYEGGWGLKDGSGYLAPVLEVLPCVVIKTP